jgi:VWFA-related protein
MSARRRRVGVLAFCLAGVAIVLPAVPRATLQQTPTQTFRTGTDVVFVDVSVRRNNQPVTGLTATDFDLRDNGVRQRVESVEATAVPIDLTLIVDVSDPARGLFRNKGAAREAVERVNKDIDRVKAILRPVDRLRVLAIDSYVHQIVSVRPLAETAPLARVTFAGRAAMFDALVTALLQPVDPSRRHVIIAGVKLRDDASAVDAMAVRDVAARSDALLHVVGEQTLAANDQQLSGFQCAMAGLCQPPGRTWAPQRNRYLLTPTAQLTPDGAFIKLAAEATGGAWHQAVLVSEPTMKGTFERAFEDFRQSYMLRYTPAGVSREGWHAITVTVPGARDVTIQARRGYGVDAPPAVPAAPAPAAVPSALQRPRSLADLAAAWDRSGVSGISASMRQLQGPAVFLDGLDAWPNPWPGQPRREAVFALDFAEATLGLSIAATYRGTDARLGRAANLLRHPIEPDEFERAWLWAHVCLAEGRFWQLPAVRVTGHARERFPDDPRFALAEAIATDQRWRTTGTVSAGARLTPTTVTEAHVAEVTAKYRAAIAFPETRAEALVRLGWLQHRIGRHEEALATLESAPTANQEPYVNYLRQLFIGHALLALNRLDEAMRAYQLAPLAVPGAQSARVALMNAMTLKGDTMSAARLANEIETAPGVIDPWWTYWFGDYRWYEQALEIVRRMAR